ncbi:hypothetical protein H072_8083 [Dactylellina haptotyla CBS 200.50]|uniref:Cytochrome P450 n=1 Tax=Dactylellina haptotyla (strain CBS 200.50) TaxID=1284197 RepID=S8AAV9_DACHA|nr:hypothetical protein H072_8083 [Dactylellina haptotyla CBS 200.50]
MEMITHQVRAWLLGPHLFSYIPICYLSFVIARWIYRLSPLHPLAKFPAPKSLLCMSQWSEFYYNVIHHGRFVFFIEQWHKELGPIIRIGPDEIHISDPSFYNICYGPGHKYIRDKDFYDPILGRLNATATIFGVPEYKHRRSIVNPLFSKSSIRKLEDVILTHGRAFKRAVSEESKAAQAGGKGICLSRLFGCLAADIISGYVYGSSFNFLETNRDADFFECIAAVARFLPIASYFRYLQAPLFLLPVAVLKRLVPSTLRSLLDLEEYCGILADKYLDRRTSGNPTEKPEHQTTIFGTILAAETPSFKPTRDMMIGEAATSLGAGYHTTSWTLTRAAYAAAINPTIQQTLHEELATAFPEGTSEITVSACEKLPYLTAFVKETLRVAPGVPGRLPRTVPPEGLVCHQKFIPSGYKVSMSAHVMHQNPQIYPNPTEFNPTRWLNTTPSSEVEKNLVAFSKGSRNCLGFNLAMAELHTALAFLFRRFKISLHKDNTLTGEWVDSYVITLHGQLMISAEEYSD